MQPVTSKISIYKFTNILIAINEKHYAISSGVCVCVRVCVYVCVCLCVRDKIRFNHD